MVADLAEIFDYKLGCVEPFSIGLVLCGMYL